jgi:alpha-glucosidase
VNPKNGNLRRRYGLFTLLLGVCVGLGLGFTLRPANFQLSGRLSVLESGAPTGFSQVGSYQLSWDNAAGGQLSVRNAAGKILWQTIPGESFVMAASGSETVREVRGMFSIKDDRRVVCTRQTVDLITDNDPGREMTLSGHLYCNDNSSLLYNVNFKLRQPGPGLLMSVWLQDPQTYQEQDKFNRLFLTYASDQGEHFFGFGEQFTHFDMKGKKVPVWVSEEGVGRGEQPITFAADITNGGAGGNQFTSYAPMPFYMTNTMRAFSLLNAAYSVFDLRSADRVQVEAWSPAVYAQILDGTTPAEITQQLLLGQPVQRPALPDWVYSAAIVGMQGGTAQVREVYAGLKQRNTPMAAFWLQDWVGQRKTSFGKQLWWNWEVDYDRYPGWDQLVGDLNKDGVAVMVYASPYLANISGLKPNMRRNLFQEASSKGYLIKNASGEPYLVLSTDFYFGMLDLTNPAARDWYKGVLKTQVLGAGAKGWMADFGEGLPYDAVLANGDAALVHNHYPELWAGLNRELVDESNNELVFFSRAAYSASPAYATLFWEGDQLVDWSREDGLKSAVTGLNTGGLSGMTFNHSDIGGYTTVSNPVLNIHRSRELLYRWMEMSAFTLIFRTHEGNQPDKNIQFYTDAESLDVFARWAKIYAVLFDYRKALVAESYQTGLPVVRHPFIHYPADPETWKITYQEFMLGADFLIAPVTDPGAKQVSAYLPQGEWVHLWSGKTYPGGQYVSVPAPIGQPGVFYLQGSTWGEAFARELKKEGLLP